MVQPQGLRSRELYINTKQRERIRAPLGLPIPMTVWGGGGETRRESEDFGPMRLGAFSRLMPLLGSAQPNPLFILTLYSKLLLLYTSQRGVRGNDLFKTSGLYIIVVLSDISRTKIYIGYMLYYPLSCAPIVQLSLYLNRCVRVSLSLSGLQFTRSFFIFYSCLCALFNDTFYTNIFFYLFALSGVRELNIVKYFFQRFTKMLNEQKKKFNCL